MDKLEKLYNLYLKEGIISDATSFEKWKDADSIKQEKLFEIGKSKGLFKTSTVDKFKAAWGEAAIPTVKKKVWYHLRKMVLWIRQRLTLYHRRIYFNRR
mgnify:CR=1 FL=1